MKIIPPNERTDEMLRLIKEYTDTIARDGGEEVRECLVSQHLTDELADLKSKYSPPSGRMYLAVSDNDDVVGCIALTKLDDDYCEMKRLYVLPEARGQNFGRILIEKILDDARDIGYKFVRLDSFPQIMGPAIKLYKEYGFYEIDNYNNNPAPSALFFEKEL